MPNFTQRSGAQREASRRNGAKSQGRPASRAVVLNTESHDRYHQLLQSFLDHFAPATPAENAVVEHYAAAEWRIRRLHATESALLDLQIDQHRPQLSGTDSATRTALALQHLDALDRISHAETRLPRNQQRALHQLALMKKLRAEPSNSLDPNEEQPENNPSETQEVLN